MKLCTNPRQFLIEARTSVGLSIKQAAAYLEISSVLLSWLESDDVAITHPNIADRIAEMYALTLEQRNSMVDPKHAIEQSEPYRIVLHKGKPGRYMILRRVLAARRNKNREGETRNEEERRPGGA